VYILSICKLFYFGNNKDVTDIFDKRPKS
jgi:hypothetical protein